MRVGSIRLVERIGVNATLAETWTYPAAELQEKQRLKAEITIA